MIYTIHKLKYNNMTSLFTLAEYWQKQPKFA